MKWPIIRNLFSTPIKFINLMANYKFSCEEKKISNENIVRVINLLTNIEKEQEQDDYANINSNYIDAVNHIIRFLKLAVKYYQFIHFKENNITMKKDQQELMKDDDESFNIPPLQKRISQTEKIGGNAQNTFGYTLSSNLDFNKNGDKDDDYQRSNSPILNYYENKLKTETDILNDISWKKHELIKRVEDLKKERNSESSLKARKSSSKNHTPNKPTHIREKSFTNSFSSSHMNQKNYDSQIFGQSKILKDYGNENHVQNVAEVNIEKNLKYIKEYKQKINKMLVDIDRKVLL